MVTNNNVTKCTTKMIMTVDDTNKNHCNTFTNIIISILISIGVKFENTISLWLKIIIIQNKNKDTCNIVLLLF